MTDSPKSDLGVRAITAVGLVAVSLLALWLGGWWWFAFVVVISIGVFAEWALLVWKASSHAAGRFAWLVFGLFYLGVASSMLVMLRWGADGAAMVIALIGAVIATDIGGYFVGRTIGGPKIAPSISPSKTWSGLGGGVFLAAVFMILFANFHGPVAEGNASWINLGEPAILAMIGIAAALIAQTGDFSESWMKRKAGVKDSGKLLPGHGGLLDRLDGHIAVLFVFGLFPFFGAVIAMAIGQPVLN